MRAKPVPTPTKRHEALQAGPPVPADTPAVIRPRLTIDLRTITPVVGGGVKPLDADPLEPVRIPGIRGHLREWWRRLYGGVDQDPEGLFEREASLWGGVGVGKGKQKNGRRREEPGERSRVVIRLDPAMSKRGTPHRPESGAGGPNNRVRANDLDFAYGLFPLRERTPQGIEYTHKLGYELSFRLIVTFRTGRGRSSAEELRDPLRELLASIWAWVHLGGVGARTRRGFGALELARSAELEGLPPGLEDLASEWKPFFTSGGRGFESLFGSFCNAADATNSSWPPLLFLGSEGTAFNSHKELLKGLREFRQGSGFARDPGSPRPGQSRWPEGNLMRLRRDASATWEHPVSESVQAQRADLGAPRAAFGLPIVMHFKSSGHPGPGRTADSEANGQILPPGLERWASPLLLRPVRSNGGHRPLVALLGDRVPDTVQLRFDRAPKDGGHAPVAASAGAGSSIGPLLQRHGGRALEAFTSWLVNQHVVAPLSLEAPRG